MKDLRDLKDFDDTRCKTYRRRINYRTEASHTAVQDEAHGFHIDYHLPLRVRDIERERDVY